MTITPEEQAALERLRINNREYDDPSYLSDSWKIIDLALREHPPDDECKLSRQELIRSIKLHEETFYDIRVYLNASSDEGLRELIATALDNLPWLINETDWEAMSEKQIDDEHMRACEELALCKDRLTALGIELKEQGDACPNP